jgi:threonine aldolase
MRQAGILAEAGLYALKHNIERLQQDHDNARLLAEGLSPIDRIDIDYDPSQTNMVFMTLPEEAVGALQAYLKENNVCISSGQRVRMVTHLDVSIGNIKTVISLIRNFFSQ